MREGKNSNPAAEREWGRWVAGGGGIRYLSLSSHWHRQGKVSAKVGGCGIGSGWQLGE